MLYAQIYQIVERIPITILYRISSNKHSGAYFFFFMLLELQKRVAIITAALLHGWRKNGFREGCRCGYCAFRGFEGGV